MSTETQATNVLIGPVRFSYAHVWEATSIDDSADKKYSVSLIIPKTNKPLIASIKAAIAAAKEQGKTSKFGGKIPANLKDPLRDGDLERGDDENYANAYFINASSKAKPGIVDKNRQPIIDQEEFYSGCFGYASVNFYPFDAKGNKGIAAGLQNLLKWKDGDKLSGRKSAEEDFADLPALPEEEDFLA